MSEVRTNIKLDDRNRFDNNPGIASDHFVSENAAGEIIPTHIGVEKYSVPGIMTNDPLLTTNKENENSLETGLPQEDLGWETSLAIPLHRQAAKQKERDLNERREAAQSLHERHLEEAKDRGITKPDN